MPESSNLYNSEDQPSAKLSNVIGGPQQDRTSAPSLIKTIGRFAVGPLLIGGSVLALKAASRGILTSKTGNALMEFAKSDAAKNTWVGKIAGLASNYIDTVKDNPDATRSFTRAGAHIARGMGWITQGQFNSFSNFLKVADLGQLLKEVPKKYIKPMMLRGMDLDRTSSQLMRDYIKGGALHNDIYNAIKKQDLPKNTFVIKGAQGAHTYHLDPSMVRKAQAYNWARNYSAAFLPTYAMASAMSMNKISGKVETGTKPWYRIDQHIKDMAKFAIVDVPANLVFSGLGYGLKSLAPRAHTAIQRLTANKGGNFLRKMIEGINTHLPKIVGYSKATLESLEKMHKSFTPKEGEKPSLWTQQFQRATQTFNAIRTGQNVFNGNLNFKGLAKKYENQLRNDLTADFRTKLINGYINLSQEISEHQFAGNTNNAGVVEGGFLNTERARKLTITAHEAGKRSGFMNTFLSLMGAKKQTEFNPGHELDTILDNAFQNSRYANQLTNAQKDAIRTHMKEMNFQDSMSLSFSNGAHDLNLNLRNYSPAKLGQWAASHIANSLKVNIPFFGNGIKLVSDLFGHRLSASALDSNNYVRINQGEAFHVPVRGDATKTLFSSEFTEAERKRLARGFYSPDEGSFGIFMHGQLTTFRGSQDPSAETSAIFNAIKSEYKGISIKGFLVPKHGAEKAAFDIWQKAKGTQSENVKRISLHLASMDKWFEKKFGIKSAPQEEWLADSSKIKLLSYKEFQDHVSTRTDAKVTTKWDYYKYVGKSLYERTLYSLNIGGKYTAVNRDNFLSKYVISPVRDIIDNQSERRFLQSEEYKNIIGGFNDYSRNDFNRLIENISGFKNYLEARSQTNVDTLVENLPKLLQQSGATPEVYNEAMQAFGSRQGLLDYLEKAFKDKTLREKMAKDSSFKDAYAWFQQIRTEKGFSNPEIANAVVAKGVKQKGVMGVLEGQKSINPEEYLQWFAAKTLFTKAAYSKGDASSSVLTNPFIEEFERNIGNLESLRSLSLGYQIEHEFNLTPTVIPIEDIHFLESGKLSGIGVPLTQEELNPHLTRAFKLIDKKSEYRNLMSDFYRKKPPPLSSYFKEYGAGGSPGGIISTGLDFNLGLSSDFDASRSLLDEYSKDILTTQKLFTIGASNRFNKVMGYVGLGIGEGFENTREFLFGNNGFTSGFLAKRVLPAAGVYAAYKAADTFFDLNPMFNQTALDEGLTVAGSEQIAKARYRQAQLMQALGVTSAAQYMEGLMPGSVESPLAKIARSPFVLGGIGKVAGELAGGARGASAGLVAGLAASIMMGFGVADLTKTPDRLADEYAGRRNVPVKEQFGWELSTAPLLGGKISYYTKSWFTKIKSQLGNAPETGGSKLNSLLFGNMPVIDFNPLGAIIDPYHEERRLWRDRPYPVSRPYFQDVPLIGQLLGPTIGSLLKPPVMMHTDVLSGMGGEPDIEGLPTGRNNPATYQGTGELGGPFGQNQYIPGTLELQHRAPIHPQSIQGITGESFYRMIEEPMGLMGFTASSLIGGEPYNKLPMYEQSNIGSINDIFYKLGGAAGLSEPIRRMFPRKRSNIESVNPLKNAMPHWLPLELQYGDPFSKVKEGEVRLPTRGRELVEPVEHTFPVSGSTMGKDVPSIVRSMLGLKDELSEETEEILSGGTRIHKLIQEELAMKNQLVQAEVPIFDPYLNLSGSIDAIVKGPFGGNRLLEIKTMDNEKFEALEKPKYEQAGQLLSYMALTGKTADPGYMLYISRQDPSKRKVFPIVFNQRRWEEIVSNVGQAREAASSLLAQGYGYPGESYSFAERAITLSNVAPLSEEYKEARQRAAQQEKMGLLHEMTIERLQESDWERQQQIRKVDTYPYRFYGKVMSPDTTYNLTEINANIKDGVNQENFMNPDEFIQPGANYGLMARIAGSAWEAVSHANIPLIHKKFLPYESPEESYLREMTRAKGFWQHPIRNFAEPWTESLMAKKNPLEGAASWGLGGFILGGPMGAVAGSAIGAGYATAHSILESNPHIPQSTQKEWEMSEYLDKLRNFRQGQMYSLTGDEEYADAAKSTFAYIGSSTPQTADDWKHLYRALPYNIKPYYEIFSNTMDPRARQNIKAMLPGYMQENIESMWKSKDLGTTSDLIAQSNLISQETLDYFNNRQLPSEDSSFWDPKANYQDIEATVVKNEGFDAHDFGMGWQNQEERMRNSPYLDDINIDVNQRMSDPENVTPLTTSNDRITLTNTLLSGLSTLGIDLANVRITGELSGNIDVSISIV